MPNRDRDKLRAVRLQRNGLPHELHDRLALRLDAPVRERTMQIEAEPNLYVSVAVRKRELRRRLLLQLVLHRQLPLVCGSWERRRLLELRRGRGSRERVRDEWRVDVRPERVV